ncbi:NAD(P)-binding protein [Cadophora sp. DSE1049]|nr:NAD(P)-binding protein [Cadophora sp. DSE1049]
MSIPESNGKTVLITGINGYIASVLGLDLLSKGYSLRGTSRRAASAEPLLKGPYAAYADRVKIYEVPDMTIDAAFDEAAKGVEGVFHTASPINFSLTDYSHFITPAIRGNQVILDSALKAGSQLSSVVITSSAAAVFDASKPAGYVFTETDFATSALERAEKDKVEGVKTPPGVLYSASKAAAEKAVWTWRDEHKPKFSISTVNPSVVIGPPIYLPSSGTQLNETLKPLFSILSGAAKEVGPNIGSGGFVDVRDVAFLHTWAYENASKSDGERFCACQGFGPLQAVADILRREYKGTSIGEKIPVGQPGVGYLGYDEGTGRIQGLDYEEGRLRVSGGKAERITGLRYIDFEKSVVDTAKVLEALI